MPDFVPVSRERHSGSRWMRFDSYSFAADSMVAPLVAAELPKVAVALPVGFVRKGEGFSPAALLSFLPGRNLFVGFDGRWIGGYVPSIFRSHPFRLLRAGDGKLVLCVDEQSGLVTDGRGGEPFFDANGELAGRTREVLDFLTKVEQSRVVTARATAALAKHGLIVPWVIRVKTEEGEKPVDGAFKIDEAAFNALPMEAFEELRRTGAPLLAWCQMLSMQHLPLLGKLADVHARQGAAVKPASQPALDALLASFDEDELQIDWSQFGGAEEDQ